MRTQVILRMKSRLGSGQRKFLLAVPEDKEDVMGRRIAVIIATVSVLMGLATVPASAEEIFDCEGNIRLACPGPVPW